MASSNITNHYPRPSIVNFSNFISTKLWFKYPNTNYPIWKEQMLCQIEGHDLVGFIDGSIQPPPPETPQEQRVSWRRSDRLLKGWILASLNEDLLSEVATLKTARDVWWELESKVLELLEVAILKTRERTTTVTKLWFSYTDTNYEIWKEQTIPMIGASGAGIRFIDGSTPPPRPQTQHELYLRWRRYDQVFKLRILGSLNERLESEVAALTTARDVWLELENKISQLQQRRQNLGLPTSTEVRPNNEVQGRAFTEYIELYKAVLEGNWEATRRIFDRDPTAITARLDSKNMTPLHLAVGTRKAIHLVQKMAEIMTDDAIARTTSHKGETALHLSTAAGNVDAARILVNRMPALLYVPMTYRQVTIFPIHTAAVHAKRKMVEYLISVTTEQEPYGGIPGLLLLLSLITAEFFDIALDLVKKYPDLVIRKLSDGTSALSLMAEYKTVLRVGSCFAFWERFIPTRFSMMEKQLMVNQQFKSLAEHTCEQIKTMSSEESLEICTNALISAARVGNRDLVEMIIEAYPNLINVRSDSGGSIFYVAVENRSERVFNLVNQMSDHKHKFVDEKDNSLNSMLHAAGKLAPSHKLNQISGAALQLQRELQWYKEVEKLVPPQSKNEENKDKKTPQMVFTEEHKQLMEDGEKWMNDTSASCSIAAALVVTIMFAAAITVPGDYDDTGFPKFSKDREFIVFGISDAISLFTSTTSLMMFLSIFTSRYAEEDFLYALPKRLIAGLVTLFLSVLFMMVAFIATVYLVVGRKNPWVFGPLVALAYLPVSSFVLLQYPLLADLISSTYGPGIFGKQSNRPCF